MIFFITNIAIDADTIILKKVIMGIENETNDTIGTFINSDKLLNVRKYIKINKENSMIYNKISLGFIICRFNSSISKYICHNLVRNNFYVINSITIVSIINIIKIKASKNILLN